MGDDCGIPTALRPSACSRIIHLACVLACSNVPLLVSRGLPISDAISKEATQNVPTHLGHATAPARQGGGCGLALAMHAQTSVGDSWCLKQQWSGEHLDFRASVLGQTTTGTVDVAEDHVRLQVQLPWLLSLLADKAKALVKKQGKLMLEKPVKPSTKSS